MVDDSRVVQAFHGSENNDYEFIIIFVSRFSGKYISKDMHYSEIIGPIPQKYNLETYLNH